MIPLNNMLTWHNLPAIILEENNIKKIVVFSNLDGNFVLCEIPYDKKMMIRFLNDRIPLVFSTQRLRLSVPDCAP